MPTTRLRHQITETDEISSAVERGLQEWPDASRQEVVRSLIVKGAEFLDLSAAERVLAAELALRELESLDIRYPEGYLADLRKDWDRYA